MENRSEIENQKEMDDEEDSMWMDDDDEDDQPEYYYCQSCNKSWTKNPGSNPCWDGGCSIDGVY